MATKIVTHSGIFHADDVCAYSILETCLTHKHKDAQVELIRTRDPEVIETADIVIDVGNQYYPGRKRYDHHQKKEDGKPEPRANGVPYSSFGLVWEHWGYKYLEILLDDGALMSEAAKIWKMFDERIVQPVDAADNAFDLVADPTEVVAGVRAMSFSAVISGFNPLPGASADNFHHEFMVASRFVKAVMARSVFKICSEVRIQDDIRMAMTSASDPRIVVLREGGSWQQVICASKTPLYVIFPAETGDTWMLQCVPPVMGSFEKRRPLPSFWAGLRDEKLAVVTGVQDAVFCHNGRFICGARSRESALRMAELAIHGAADVAVRASGKFVAGSREESKAIAKLTVEEQMPQIFATLLAISAENLAKEKAKQMAHLAIEEG